MNQGAVVGGATGEIKIDSSTWTALRVGSSNYTGRKYLLIQNKSNVRIAFTTDSTQAYKSCPEIGVGHMVQIPVTESVTIYAKSRTGAVKRISIMELA